MKIYYILGINYVIADLTKINIKGLINQAPTIIMITFVGVRFIEPDN